MAVKKQEPKTTKPHIPGVKLKDSTREVYIVNQDNKQVRMPKDKFLGYVNEDLSRAKPFLPHLTADDKTLELIQKA